MIYVILNLDRHHKTALFLRVILIQKIKKMSALFVLIAISLIVAVVFLLAFIWSFKEGQYDDDYTPSIRMLLEDQPNENNKK